jgi:hypothetical protein
MMDCVFNNSGFLDAAGAVDPAATKAKILARTSGAYTDIINSNFDKCWSDAQSNK